MSTEEADAIVFGRDEYPSVSILMPSENARDTKVKEIKVLGKSAKAVTYVENFTGNFSKQYMYWTAYTNEEPVVEDFKVIME
ncbi:hypothetical protein [Virgibacillus litoralis]|uniref:Uncharacterized protein n=1 Tax=Virgibacillus litoralis TaxID=578221 RepID=A0ABS4H9A7_9BACI|nr:hypothetical protein [Virgibacillus litoralis]MBP1947463.1 hypothetical protein [Virgibacillus litoralis]